MATITQPIKWHGGKHYLASWIISLMPPRVKNPNAPASDDPGWLHYVEPYFGGGSVLFAQDPEGISEAVNDTNIELMNFWRIIRDQPEYGKFQHLVEMTPFSQPAWKTTRLDRPIDRIEDAVNFFVRYRQSRQGLGKDFATLSRNRTRRGMNEQVSSWLTAVEGLPEAHERLRRVVILNDDALKVIKQQDGPRTHFYCDPPYLHETRETTKEYGEQEMTPDEHHQLLETLGSVKGTFQLSGYMSELYEDFAQHFRWRREVKEIDNKASSKKSKDTKQECLWMNY